MGSPIRAATRQGGEILCELLTPLAVQTQILALCHPTTHNHNHSRSRNQSHNRKNYRGRRLPPPAEIAP